MELKLNIYDEQENIIKTYTRNSYSVRMRLLKDIISTLQLDTLSKVLSADTKESNMALVEIVGSFVTNAYDKVQELMMSVFPGLTDEEYLDVHLDEVIQTVINLVKFSFSTISLAGSGGKN